MPTCLLSATPIIMASDGYRSLPPIRGALQHIANGWRDSPRIEKLQVARLLRAARKDPPTLEKPKGILLPRGAFSKVEMVSWQTCLERLRKAKDRRESRHHYHDGGHGLTVAVINAMLR